MAAESTLPRRRATRLRLYLPFLLLLLAAIGWSVAWFVIRDRVLTGLDDWLSAEAASGRQWNCPDRAAGGYPFRIEITCPALSVQRPDLAASVGRVVAVSQVYAPGHVIVEAQGPVRLEAGGATLDATWRLLQASVVSGAGQFERAALAVDGVTARGVKPGWTPLDLTATRLEIHLRPDPGEATTTDVALDIAGAVVPGLDALVGGDEPADLTLVAAVTRTNDLPARPLAAEIDRWRNAGGRLDIARVAMTKGARRVEAKGSFGIDDARRPQGQIEASAARLEGLAGRLVGDKSVLGASLLGALLGAGARTPPPASPDPNAPALRPVPTVRLEGGRVFLGPLPIPGMRLPALY